MGLGPAAWSGERRSRISQLGGAVALGLWLLLQAVPGLKTLLLLR